MATELAPLGSLLNTYANIAALQQQQMYLENQQSKCAAQLAVHQKYEAAYEKAWSNAMGNKEVLAKGTAYEVQQSNSVESIADRYAHAKVEQYDQELLLELSELDIEYQTMIEAINTQIEAEQARLDAYKNQVSNGVADTAIIGGE